MSTAIAHYLAEFERLAPSLPWQDSPQWQAWRQAGWDHFAAGGFPTARHEEWKYTSLAALEKLRLPCGPRAAAPLEWDTLRIRALLPEARHRLVFVDGTYQPQLSRLGPLPAGIHVQALSTQTAERSAALQAFLGTVRARTPFAALNAAFMADGVWASAEAGACLEEPLLILHVTSAGHQVHHLANVVQVAEGACLTVVEQYLGLTDAPCFLNQVTSLHLGAGAALTHLKLQQEGAGTYHIGALQAHQQRDSRLESHAFALSGVFGRNDMETVLAEPGAGVVLKGLYRVAGRELQDFHTSIRHDSPDCSSEECFKGVLEGNGRAVFNGKIRVARDAQHTVSQQTNHNLLLSDQAEVDTKPQLEIFADDVKCSHGTTVGQLDESQWFYLRSRGIGADLARALLIEAFALDIVASVPVPAVREALEQLVRSRDHV